MAEKYFFVELSGLCKQLVAPIAYYAEARTRPTIARLFRITSTEWPGAAAALLPIQRIISAVLTVAQWHCTTIAVFGQYSHVWSSERCAKSMAESEYLVWKICCLLQVNINAQKWPR
jgi:hypothetical protein